MFHVSCVVCVIPCQSQPYRHAEALINGVYPLCPAGSPVRTGLLVATSGDTGSAALYGFSRYQAPVVVLFPQVMWDYIH